MSDIKKVAKEHADWYVENLSFIIHKVYEDAFLHGYKHGLEDKNE